MEKASPVAVVGLTAVLLFSLAQAQTNATAATINVGLVTHIAMTGFMQTSSSTITRVRMSTKDVLAAVNASGGFQFGNNARLLLVSTEDQEPIVWVQEGTGTNAPLVDISSFFTITQPAEVDAHNRLISYAIRVFSFDDHQGTTFTVSGFTAMRRTRIISGVVGPLMRVSTAQAQVGGEGTVKGAPAVFRGKINAGAPEVLPSQI